MQLTSKQNLMSISLRTLALTTLFAIVATFSFGAPSAYLFPSTIYYSLFVLCIFLIPLRISFSCFFVLLHVIYAGLGAFVFFTPTFLALNAETRELYLFLAFFIIACLIVAVSILRSNPVSFETNILPLTKFLVPFVFMDILIKLLLGLAGYGSAYNSDALNVNNASSLQLAIIVLSAYIGFVSIITVTLNLSLSSPKPIVRALCYTYLVIALAWIIFYSASRFQIILFSITFIILYARKSRNNDQITRLMLCSAPFCALIFTSSIMNLLGRNVIFSFDDVLYELSYRTSFVDYTLPFVNCKFAFGSVWDALAESLNYSLPRIFNPDKSISIESIATLNQQCGLLPYIDYTDNLFSLSTVMLGLVGLPVSFFLFLVSLIRMDYLASRLLLTFPFFAISFILPLLFYSLQIEIGFAELFLKFRDFLLASFLSFLIILLYRAFLSAVSRYVHLSQFYHERR